MYDAEMARLQASFGELASTFHGVSTDAEKLTKAFEQLPDETKEEPESEPS